VNLQALRFDINNKPRHATHAESSLLRKTCTTPIVTPDQARSAMEQGVSSDTIAKIVLNNMEYDQYWPKVEALLRQRDQRNATSSKECRARVDLPILEQHRLYDAARQQHCEIFKADHIELVMAYIQELSPAWLAS